MGTFNPAEFAAQCQVPQSQVEDLTQDDSGWHTQHGKEADSPSVGRANEPHATGDETTEKGTPTGKDRSADDVSADLVQDAGRYSEQKDDNKEDFERDDACLEPLPGSPGGLAPAYLLDNENPRGAAPDVHARPADAMPLTQAPGMHDSMGFSQEAFASQQESPEKASVPAVHNGSDPQGAGHSASPQKTTMFGKGLRAVLSPFGIRRFSGIFGDKGRSDGQKRSFQAGGSQAEDGIPQHGSTVPPAAPTSPSLEAKDPVTSLKSSPRGAAVRQGLDIIEQAHRMGDAKLKLVEPAFLSSGAVTGASAAGAPAGVTEAIQLAVEDAEGPVMAAVEVDGQTVNAVVLQPMSAEAAKEAADHQIVAPNGVPAGADIVVVAPILAPDDEAQEQAPVAARLSRKRMQPGADASGTPQAAAQAEEAGGTELEKQKRKRLTGMAVVWKYFGLKDPKAQSQ